MSEPAAAAAAPWTDPREQIEYSVLLCNGRLAPRSFANREEAEAWADVAAGEQVVSYNAVCDCQM
ncbi:MAG: hypothetical protein ACK5H2_10970 [Beutenbergiaceae bacterium]